MKHDDSSPAISKAASWLGVVAQLTFGYRDMSPLFHLNMLGTLKVYTRMYALKLRRSIRRQRNRRILSTKSDAWVITLDSPRNGLFAHLTWCVAIWARAEKLGCRVSLRAVSSQYGRPDVAIDWFKTLFFNKHPVFKREDKLGLTLAEYEEWPDYEKSGGFASLTEASTLFYKYCGVQPALMAEVDCYCAQQWGSEPVLGVHYRGTDKSIEAPPVSFEIMIDHVGKALALWPELGTVYVATDEERFPHVLRRAFPRHRVIFADGALRSSNGRAVHHLSESDGLRRAREAVFDCLVLSRTSLLLKTASMLSGWSAVLSPNLPTILINPPYPQANFFPDCALQDRIGDLPSRIASARLGYMTATTSPVA